MRSSGMDQVAPASLDWALAHIKRFGDTDILPVPFEFEAISHAWTALRPELAERNLADLRLGPARRYTVPKPGGGYRGVVQLDPLDALLYTALAYEMAPDIENGRIAADEKVACSYRINLTPNGSFFPRSNGWDDFHNRSSELANSAANSHVLVADISDFYNQISHHRIENALEGAGISRDRAQNVERFLGQLTMKQSRGLPVGPYATILLAELCLNDVDTFLLRKRTSYVRYVDDFRIFCSSRREAIRMHHDLAEYLYTSHRLSLESSKTKVMSVDDFMRAELRDPAEEEDKLHATLNDLDIDLNPYGDDEELEGQKLDSDSERNTLSVLFRDCISRTPFHLGLARFILRRARSMGSAFLHGQVFGDLERLTPALREVAMYIIKTLPAKSCSRRGTELLSFIRGSDVASLPFVQLWSLEMLEQQPRLASQNDALKIAEESGLGVRSVALMARRYGALDWVRARKETWNNNAEWDRRAIIWSASVLPSDERHAWLGVVKDMGDSLDRAVAQFADTNNVSSGPRGRPKRRNSKSVNSGG